MKKKMIYLKYNNRVYKAVENIVFCNDVLLYNIDTMEKISGVQGACRLLRKLCAQSKLARALALRDLLETAMFREERAFGSRPHAAAASPVHHRLMHLNQQHVRLYT